MRICLTLQKKQRLLLGNFLHPSGAEWLRYGIKGQKGDNLTIA